MGNLSFLGLFRAEAAPMHARRYDIVVQATAHVLLFFGAHLVKFGHVRYLTEVLFHSYAHLFLWMWLLPIAAGTAARAVHRRELRRMRDAKLNNKLKSL